jgi:hypothetical protein
MAGGRGLIPEHQRTVVYTLDRAAVERLTPAESTLRPPAAARVK